MGLHSERLSVRLGGEMSDLWDYEALQIKEAPVAERISAPWWMIVVQGVLAMVSFSSLSLNSLLARVLMWGVAVLAALFGVAYRYQLRKRSIEAGFRGVSASRAVSMLFWTVFLVSLAAIVAASYRASLVFPE